MTGQVLDIETICPKCDYEFTVTYVSHESEAAEARAAQAERQNEIYAAELDALAQRELRIRAERDEMRHKLNEARGIARRFAAERDAARKQLEQARETIAAAIAEEREACAELAKSMIGATRHEIAAAIRARQVGHT